VQATIHELGLLTTTRRQSLKALRIADDQPES
jgi:hypothetical protein